MKNKDWNFDNWNNGLSLVALSLSIILLPSARIKKEVEQKEIDDLIKEISKRDSRISQIEKERDDHVSRIEKERESRILRIEKERDEYVSRIENDHDKIVNNLKQKAINDLLTANEQSRIERNLLKEKVDNLNEKNRDLRKTNRDLRAELNLDSNQLVQTKSYPIMVSQSDSSNSSSSSSSSLKRSIPEEYSVVRDFSKISDLGGLVELTKPLDIPIHRIEFPKAIDYSAFSNFPKTIEFAESIFPGRTKSWTEVEKDD